LTPTNDLFENRGKIPERTFRGERLTASFLGDASIFSFNRVTIATFGLTTIGKLNGA